MDPKTAAKVTTPELLKAFQEGHGLDLDNVGTKVKAWVAFITDGVVVRAAEFEEIMVALVEAEIHLLGGEGRSVGIVMSSHHPAEQPVLEAVSDTDE